MRQTKKLRTKKLRISFQAIAVLTVGLASLAVLPACSVNVKKGQGDEDKQVDINTPVGGIHVSKNADPGDVGIPVYPGARQKDKDGDGSNKSANVDVSSFGYGVRVVALQYESDASPEKLVAFYKDQLKQYGNVLICHTSHMNVDTDIKGSDHPSSQLTCEGGDGKNVELKVGTKENQHIVAVEPDGRGSTFSLVYVRTHGKQADI